MATYLERGRWPIFLQEYFDIVSTMTKLNKDSEKDLDYSTLFNDLSKRKQPTRLVDLPAFDEAGNPICQVLIRTLTHDDHVDIQRNATIECDRIFKDQLIERDSKVYRERHDNITAKHFIFRSCRDPESENKPFFPTPDHVGRYLSNDEIAVLLQHYETLQAERGPVIAFMDDAKFEEWIAKLGKGAEEAPYFLDRFLPEAKNQFLMYMARQLMKSQTDKFSATLPVDNSIKK